MAILTFPYSLFPVRTSRLDLLGVVIRGGQSQLGQQQVVNATGGGLWALQMEFNKLRRADQIRAWRALQYGQQGGVRSVNITLCEIRHAPRPSDWTPGGVPHSDDTPFSDTSLYASSLPVATLVLDAPLRATGITLAFQGDAEPIGGELFSLRYGDGRFELHAITEVLAVGDNYFVTFEPPLRAAHIAGEEVEFGHPTGTFSLAQQDGMGITLELGRSAEASATFIEQLWTPPAVDYTIGSAQPFDFAGYFNGMLD